MTGRFTGFPQTAEELKEFLINYNDKLTNHALQMLGDVQDAEDVVQESLVKAYSRRLELTNIGNPPAYVFRMVNNKCLDLLRSRTRKRDSNSEIMINQSAYSESREESYIREEEHNIIRLLLDLLPAEQAEVIRYRFSDELTFKEIAEITEVPATTVKSRFTYGMIKLRSMIKEQKEVSNEV